jgi:hypothetical protein
MSLFFNIPPFLADQRGNKLKKFKVGASKRGGQVVLLCGPNEIASQLLAWYAADCSEAPLSEKGAREWTHAIHFPDGVPAGVSGLLEGLEQWVTLTGREDVNLGMSVDWFKKADDEGDLVVTEMGRRINYTKYAPYPNGSSSVKARRELHDAMVELIETHPAYAATGIVTSPPGSTGDGNSFGERLGQALASRTGKTFIPTAGPARPPQKEEGERAVRDDFVLTERINERVLVIDDVFHTGSTLDATARAARRSGATEVITLTAARTLRK